LSRLRDPRASPREGFAAIDAITALAILSITIALCIQAGSTSLKAVRAAREIRRAEALGRFVLALPVRGPRAGETPQFTWRVEVARDMTAPAAQAGLILCRRTVSAVARQGGRRFGWETVTPCSREDLMG
jgi:hypothetical protein